jgi:hypothetical protein
MKPLTNLCVCRDEFLEDSEGNCFWTKEAEFESTKTVSSLLRLEPW